MSIDWLLDIPTVSEANNTDHWAIKNKRKNLQKKIIRKEFLIEKPKIEFPCIVILTRIGLRELDYDNLVMCFKAIRDAIADNLLPGKAAGKADSDKRITWHYMQKPGKIRRVRIQIYSHSEYREVIEDPSKENPFSYTESTNL